MVEELLRLDGEKGGQLRIIGRTIGGRVYSSECDASIREAGMKQVTKLERSAAGQEHELKAGLQIVGRIRTVERLVEAAYLWVCLVLGHGLILTHD